MYFLNSNLYYEYCLSFFNFIIGFYINIHTYIKKIIKNYFYQPYIDEISIINEFQVINLNKLKGKKKINITDLYNLFKNDDDIKTFFVIKYYYNDQYYRFILNYNVISFLYKHKPNKQIFPFQFDNNIHCPKILTIEINDDILNLTIGITEFIMSFIGPHSNIYPIPYGIIFKDIIKILSINSLIDNDNSIISLMDTNLETHNLSIDTRLKVIENHK